MAATLCLTVLRALVAIDNAPLADLFAELFVFRADFELFAALRFLVMIPVS
jgi:hypothetical protein